MGRFALYLWLAAIVNLLLSALFGACGFTFLAYWHGVLAAGAGGGAIIVAVGWLALKVTSR